MCTVYVCMLKSGYEYKDSSIVPSCSGSTRMLTCLLSGQKEHNTNCSVSPRCSSSLFERENPSSISSLFSPASSSSSSNLKCKKGQELQSSQTAPSAGNSEDEHLKESSSQSYESSELQLEHLAATVVKQALNNALTVMDGQSQANTSECFSKLGDQPDCTGTVKSCECKVCLHSADGCRERLEGRKEKVQEDERGTGVEERTELLKKNWEVGRRGTNQENVLDICCHGICCHGSSPGLDEFKEFLRGTPGEKLFNLWMDIERLKSTQNRERKNR